MSRSRELKEQLILSGEKAVEELIKVANEAIVTHSDDDLTADKMKNAAAAKKLAIFDAFEILKRIEEERNELNGVVIVRDDSKKGFAEKHANKLK